MARIDNINNFLTDVANSIRNKTGKTDDIPASEFDVEIESISGGGSEDLTEELANYDSSLTTQEVTIQDILKALEGKAIGGVLNHNQLEYIQLNGKTHYQLDKPLNSNCRIVAKFTRDTSKECGLFGQANYNTNTNDSFGVRLGANSYQNGRIHSEYGTYAQNDIYFSSLATEIILDANKNVWTYTDFNGSLIKSLTFPTKEFVNGTNCYVGATMWNNDWLIKLVGKLYYFKIYEDNVLIHSLVPVKRSNGMLTLFDQVTETYLTNLGTEDPLEGPIVQ